MGQTSSITKIASITLSAFLFLLIFMSVPEMLHAEDSVCARVKIEIKQELTLERQAFDAHMRINNGLSHITLEDVDVDVSFADEEGNPVLASSDPDNTSALFFIRIDSMENISGVDGTGTVPPASSADIHWLIIPAPGAAGNISTGKLYFVGARLTYTIGGEENITEVTPDHIYVKPMPELVLDYFLTKEVYGDDAFTSEIEPIVPFTLGVRVKNNGHGVAKNLKIDSAQPKIVENELGLLIGFAIEGSEVNGQPATDSLLVDFGDIEPGTAGVGRWIMTCTLSGEFVEFEAEYSHSDELGGELTSLIQEINAHFLVRDVWVDLNGRDSIVDFLARDGDVYRVYESETVDTTVTDQSGLSSLSLKSQDGSSVQYTLSTPVDGGFIYTRLPDPFSGQKIIEKAVRSDGKTIKAENIWLSKTRNGQSWDYHFNLFDAATTGIYTIWFEDVSALPQPPVLQYINDKIRVEGQQLSFIVEASDPNGTIPSLSAAPLPAGAVFTDQGDGTGIFDWTPSVGQSGVYHITFQASDGVLTASRRVMITVRSVDDTDGDGMSDAWELLKFGTLDRDGTGDFDGDGISDLDEYQYGSDPLADDHAPSVPVILSPENHTEITQLQPLLTVVNSSDEDGDVLTYDFQIYSDPELTDRVAAENNVTQDIDHTAWTVPESLSDNTWYYWRARAGDGYSYSLWVYGSFFINTENDAPGPFHISNPAGDMTVATTRPVLSVTGSLDPDQDTVSYGFQVYTDHTLITLAASGEGILDENSGTASWTPDIDLDDQTSYVWRAVATDEHGTETLSAVSAFYVDTQVLTPGPPALFYPADNAVINASDLELTVQNIESTEIIDYYFELDRVNSFDSPEKMASGPIPESADTTVWPVSGLMDNTLYFWRVKASNGVAQSGWSMGRFFISTANDNPSGPVSKNPGDQAWVGTVTPVLEVAPSIDPDNDSIFYRFEIYEDAQLTQLVSQATVSDPEYIVSEALSDDTRYYWRVQAEDENGLTSQWTELSDFFVNKSDVDAPPQITVTTPSQAVITNADAFQILWEDQDEDSNAQIALYYDTDSTGEDGVLITDGLLEDTDGAGDSYTWDLTGMEGVYWVYAVINDGTTSVTSYSPGSIILDRTPPVVSAAPPGGTYTQPQSVTLSSEAGALIYFTTDGSDPTAASVPYTQPIVISDTTTLKYIAMDTAGNVSTVDNQVYTITPEQVTIHVSTGKGRLLSGLNVYAFTETGSYTGKYNKTDAAGDARFNLDDFVQGTYTFRIDYLGEKFWSAPVVLPASSVDVVIEEETVRVTVTDASGAVEAARVYLFSSTGSYLGAYEVTDANGQVSFLLPVGVGFTFRADILGGQYWLEETTVAGGGINDAALSAGGGTYTITVQEDADIPLANIRIYLFGQNGNYLGLYRVSDASGHVSFNVPDGTYKVRADYLGYQFWGDDLHVSTDTHMDLNIPHQDVTATVNSRYENSDTAVEGVKVYLFTESCSYLSRYGNTDGTGSVVFHLPQKAYKIRADYLARQYWSDAFVWSDPAITLPMADARITVSGGGFPMEGQRIYVFSTQETYLGLYEDTDANGQVLFRLPEGSYNFRADHLNSQYWAEDVLLTADQVNPVDISVGGGSFTFTVFKEAGVPLAGVKTYLFDENDVYLGMFGATDSTGQVSFDLADGGYRFRVDYMGCQFWSTTTLVPDYFSADLTIGHETVDVSVQTRTGPAPGNRVYLFSETGAYLNQYKETDTDGTVSFDLPTGETFTFRADVLGGQYFSAPATVAAGTSNTVFIDAGGGLFRITFQEDTDTPMQGIKGYLFNTSGSYLGLSQVSDANGQVAFDVPQGTYRVRADHLGYQFFSTDTLVDQDTDIDLTIAHQPVEVTISEEYQTIASPVRGIRVYLFSPAEAYLGVYETTDADGKVVFNLPDKPYKVRADYLGHQFWTPEIQSQDMALTLSQGSAIVHVTRAGADVNGATVYLFTEPGAYLGRFEYTDENGIAQFMLPDQTFMFRVDEGASQVWSDPVMVQPDGEQTLEVVLD